MCGVGQDCPKLDLGYIGVVNRSQKDIDSKRTIQDARAKEAMYFAQSDAYRSIASTMGTNYLVKRCAEQLVQAISQELPSISKQLNELIR